MSNKYITPEQKHYAEAAGKVKGGLKWTSEHYDVLSELLKAHNITAQELLDAIEQKTGIYRMPGAIKNLFHNDWGLLKIPPTLNTGIANLSREVSKQKLHILEMEKDLLKKGLPLPDMISSDTATKLVGGVQHRLKELPYWLHRASGLNMYRTAEVKDLVARLGDQVNAARVSPAVTTTKAKVLSNNDLERAIVDVMLSARTMHNHCFTQKDIVEHISVGGDRLRAFMPELVKRSVVLEREHPTNPLSKHYILPVFLNAQLVLPTAEPKKVEPDRSIPGDKVFKPAVNTAPVETPPKRPSNGVFDILLDKYTAGKISAEQLVELEAAFSKHHQ